MTLYELHRDVDELALGLDGPAMVVALDGWFDAGLSAAGAIGALLASTQSESIATFDSDALLDQRARRPVVRIVDGINTSVTWPEVQLRLAEDSLGHRALLLVGPEPDAKWRAFAADVVALSQRIGVRMLVGLGGFPAPAPHTRPIRLAATASSPELARQVGFVPGTMDVPAGMQAVLERMFAEAGIPAVGLWARVPHYVSNMPSPSASIALLEAVADLSGLVLDLSDLHGAAEVSRQRIEELLANSSDHVDVVRQLEAQFDRETGAPGLNPIESTDIPSGDELAAELERFLRDQGNS